MANRRTIQSPGVEIRERDLSTRQPEPQGTNVFVAGFAQQGPTDEILNVTSLSEFEQVFGAPSNAAERYFYQSVRELAESPANILVSRVPYGSGSGEGFGNNFSALVYPVLPIPSEGSIDPLSGTNLQEASAYYFGEPTHVTMTDDIYQQIQQGGLNWSTTAGASSTEFVDNDINTLGQAGLIVVNKAKVSVDERFKGYYIGLADNTNIDPTSDFNSLSKVYAIDEFYSTGFVEIPDTRLGFSLSAENDGVSNSTSEIIEDVPNFDIEGSSFHDTLIAGVFKLRPSIFGQDTTILDQVPEEGFFGSFNSQRKIQDQNGGQAKTFYFKDRVNDSSRNIEVFVNPNISEKNSWADEDGDDNNPIRKVRVFKSGIDSGHEHYDELTTAQGQGWFEPGDNLYTFSVFTERLPQKELTVIGDVPSKLDRILRLAENPEVVPLDITVDAGLSTIYTSSARLSSDTYEENDKVDLDDLDRTDGQPTTGDTPGYYQTVFDIFDRFARQQRKDHLFISDPLRHIFVQGEKFKRINDKSKTFSQLIYWPLKNLYQAANTSYSTTYGNWVRRRDSESDKFVWLPFSGYAAAIMAAGDAAGNPWDAPAGLNRGLVTGVTDIAINPNQKQRDLLYRVNVNPVIFSPNDGYSIEGQKTLQKKPSAFDRINVRRLFLVLEKQVLGIAKFFVFEPNTTFTRSRLINTITPVFELARNTEGLYDYLIIADERNNTPNVIDDNTLIVDIYIKPVRTAEFILVNFHATRTDTNFAEII